MQTQQQTNADPSGVGEMGFFDADDARIPHCQFTQDQLRSILSDETNYGQNVEAWCQYFRFGVNRSTIWCKACCRPIAHHKEDGTRPRQPKDEYLPFAPISCDQTQSRMVRSLQKNDFACQFLFKQNPETAETICAACRYGISMHANGQDIADAMTNALGFGQLMNGMSGGQLGGDHRVQLTPEQEAYLQQREQLSKSMLPVASSHECPFTQEHLDIFEIEFSCHNRFSKVHSMFFERGPKPANDPNGTGPLWCSNCKTEPKYHRSDGSRPAQPEDAYTPRAKLACGQRQISIRKNMGGMLGAFVVTQHPKTGETLCSACKYPIEAHIDGPDPGVEMINKLGLGGMMNLANALAGKPPEYNSNPQGSAANAHPPPSNPSGMNALGGGTQQQETINIPLYDQRYQQNNEPHQDAASTQPSSHSSAPAGGSSPKAEPQQADEAKKMGLAVLIALLVTLILYVLALPLPVMNVASTSHTMFDSVYICSKAAQHLRVAGAFAYMAIISCVVSLMAVLFEYAGHPLPLCPFVASNLTGHVVLGTQWLLTLLPWAIVAGAFHSELCPGVKPSTNGSLSGGGFAFALMAWLCQFFSFGVYEFRQFRFAGKALSPVVELEAISAISAEIQSKVAKKEGSELEAPLYEDAEKQLVDGGHDDAALAKQRHFKGSSYYMECFVFYGSVTVFGFLIFSLPLEVLNFANSGFTMFSDNTCGVMKTRLRAAGAFAFFSIFASMGGIFSLLRDYLRKPLHALATPILLVSQNFCMLLVWSIVAGTYNATLCGAKPSATPNSGYQVAFVLILLAWLLHLGVIGVFVLRRYVRKEEDPAGLFFTLLTRMARRRQEEADIQNE